MKLFEVTIAVSDEKTFTVAAENEKDAREKTALIYSSTDLLDFDPLDMTPVIADVCELDDLDDDPFFDEDCKACPPEKKANCDYFRAVQKQD